ncbi:polyprotein [Dregea volubilis polerovirus 1]|nr:polyprotein [Dregea volubilis polerovirus 1]
MSMLGLFTTFLVLSAFLSQFFSYAEYDATAIHTNLDYRSHAELLRPSFNGVLTSSGVHHWIDPIPAEERWNWATQKSPLRTPGESHYSDVVALLFTKVWSDVRNASSMVWKASEEFSNISYLKLKKFSHDLTELSLWLLATVWFRVICASALALWTFLTTFSLPVIALSLLGCLTIITFRAVTWVFSQLYLSSILKAGKTILKTLKSAFSSKRVETYRPEKATEGFREFIIPQNPPRDSQLLLQYTASKTPCGYATCIRLYNGENALLTTHHAYVDVDQLSVVSTRKPCSIPLTHFKVLKGSPKADLVILVGPPNWEAALACKGAGFLTAQQLGKGPATFHTFEESRGKWLAHNSEIVGSSGSWNVAVLSNTQPGDSGLPYFRGKIVCGMHVGASEQHNYNIMVPIPHIVGLTAPQYVFETPSNQGMVLEDKQLEALADEFMKNNPEFFDYQAAEQAAKDLKNFKSKTGKNWADYDDDYYDPEKLPRVRTVSPSAPYKTPPVGSPRKPVFLTESQEAEFLGLNDKVFYPQVDSTKVVPETRGNEAAAPTAKTTEQPTANAAPESATPKVGVDTGKDLVADLMKVCLNKVDMSAIEKAIVERVSTQMLKSKTPRRRRPQKGRAGGKKQPPASEPTSTPSTSGVKKETAPKKEAPKKQFQASASAAPSPTASMPKPSKGQNGEKNSAKFIPSWRKRQQDSAGPSSDQKLKGKA